MSDDSAVQAAEPCIEPGRGDCPLPVALQRRNMLLYGLYWAFFYLSAPISYVGVTHANLLTELDCNDKVANLPAAGYQWMTAVPILVAWFFPQSRHTKPLVVGSMTATGLMTGAVALAMWQEFPRALWPGLIIAHGLIFGVASGLSFPAIWEIVRRGISSDRRGKVLGFAFGVGPLFALAGSLAQQLILSGHAHAWNVAHLPFPGNYMLLFAAATPVLFLAALLSMAFVVPAGGSERMDAPRPGEIIEGLKDFATSRPIVLGVIAYVLVYAGGNAIMATVSMMAKDAVQKNKEENRTADGNEASNGTVGYQNELRFGFKAFAGALLGWLLAKTHPKAALLATTLTLIGGVSWALVVTGPWYLVSMGLLGAGELFGAYFPNYVASASRKSRVRLNMSYLMVVGALAGFASLIFGAISDASDRRVSLYVAVGVLVGTMLMICLVLPADPRPAEGEGGDGKGIEDGG